jgi:tetratricopeptide (TPR) repeat protein
MSPDLSYAQRQGAAAAARLVQQGVAAARSAKAKATAAEEAPAPAEAAPAEAAPAVDDSDFEALSKETVRLLSAREFDKAMPLARRLIDLRPDSAFGYRCLGSALQDLGKMKEAREVYSECVTNAKKGEVLECSALGGVLRKSK